MAESHLVKALKRISTDPCIIPYSMGVYETAYWDHQWTGPLSLAGVLEVLTLCELVRPVVGRNVYIVTEVKEPKLTAEKEELAGWH